MKREMKLIAMFIISAATMAACSDKSQSEKEYNGIKMNKQLAEKLLEYQENPILKNTWSGPGLRELGDMLALNYASPNPNMEATAFMDESGEIVFVLDNVNYHNVDTFRCGLSLVTNANHECGIVNTKGEMVVPFGKYDNLTYYKEDYAVFLKDHKIGFLNAKGEEIRTTDFEDANIMKNGLVVPFKRTGDDKERAALYKRNGEELVPEGGVYNVVESKEAVLIQAQDKTWSAYDARGNSSPLDVDEVEEFKPGWNGLTVVKKDGKVGFINSKGKLVIPCEYDDAERIAWEEGTVGFVGVALVKNGKRGVYDDSGKQVWPFEYDAVYTCSKNLISCRKDGTEGVMNRKGEWLAHGKILPVYDNLAPAAGEDGAGLQNADGEIVLPCEYRRDLFNSKRYNERLGILELYLSSRAYVYFNTKSGKEIYRGAGTFFLNNGMAAVEEYDDLDHLVGSGVIDCTGKYIVHVKEKQYVSICGKYIMIHNDGTQGYQKLLDAKGKEVVGKPNGDFDGGGAAFLDGYYFTTKGGNTYFVNGKGKTFSIDGILKLKDMEKEDSNDQFMKYR